MAVSEILLPFAREISTNKTVAPEEVPSGNACNCECLFCGALVQARHCSTRANHFAHQPKVVDEDHPCPACFERCIFWMTKRILDEGHEITLPAYKVTHSDSWLGLEKEYPITSETTNTYKVIHFPEISMSFDNRIDITISINNHPVKLVLSYNDLTHTPTESTVHISLDFLRKKYKEQRQGFLIAMQELILDTVDAKKWLYHSKAREEKCEKHFRDMVKAKEEHIAVEEKAKRQAFEQREAKIRSFRKKTQNAQTFSHQQTQKKPNPHIADRVTRRLKELVRIAEEAAASGVKSGWQCRSCYVVTTSKPEQCPQCCQENIQEFDFSEDNMAHLENKFYCGNYAAKSIEAAPRLIFI